eukprot:5365751-Pyramimonas_sp.AAC.1
MSINEALKCLRRMCAVLRRETHIEDGPPSIREILAIVQTNVRGAKARATFWNDPPLSLIHI